MARNLIFHILLQIFSHSVAVFATALQNICSDLVTTEMQAPAGLFLVGAIDFLYGWSKTVAETLFVFLGNTSGVRFVLLTLHPRINPGVTHRKSLQDFTFVCK